MWSEIQIGLYGNVISHTPRQLKLGEPVNQPRTLRKVSIFKKLLMAQISHPQKIVFFENFVNSQAGFLGRDVYSKVD